MAYHCEYLTFIFGCSGVARFCKIISNNYPDLMKRVNESGRLDCTREPVKRFTANLVLDQYYS